MPVPKSAPYRTGPGPSPGLDRDDFFRVCSNGFGDGHNSFPHSAAWYQDHLYIGTTRSNLHMMKVQITFQNLPVHIWPVDAPDDGDAIYRDLDRRAQIWRYLPDQGVWSGVFRSPLVDPLTGNYLVARETGLRAMATFQGKSDTRPSLYVSTWATGRAPGALLLRTQDGINFEPVTPYGIIKGLPIAATRVLVSFRDKLLTSPTGIAGHGKKMVINVSGYPVVFETRDPVGGDWTLISEPGFGEEGNLGVFTMCEFNDQIYGGTVNNSGFQVWRSKCEGKPPYQWIKVVDQGAYRGPLNQAVACMKVFKNALYVGSGIQNGGYDRTNNIGPGASELIRIHPDDSWDLIVGTTRSTPVGKKVPLSALPPGFGNPFNGYFWSMGQHDGWLYLGTMSTGLFSRFLKHDDNPDMVQRIIKNVGLENIISHDAGCHLWRSADGENWLPVTRNSFDNEYNIGIRNIIDSPHGLFLAVANPFGPRVAVCEDATWKYMDNTRGGLEVWQGNKCHNEVKSLLKIDERAIW